MGDWSGNRCFNQPLTNISHNGICGGRPRVALNAKANDAASLPQYLYPLRPAWKTNSFVFDSQQITPSELDFFARATVQRTPLCPQAPPIRISYLLVRGISMVARENSILWVQDRTFSVPSHDLFQLPVGGIDAHCIFLGLRSFKLSGFRNAVFLSD